MGVRQSWVYPSDGGEPYLKGNAPAREANGRGPMIMGDLPDFVSPIDQKVYSGRAGMREHNQKHNVVPTADLKGLPYLTTTSDTRSPQQKRADASKRKELIIQNVNRHYR